jgi:DNA-binding response OmpR family regulator
MDVQMPNVNGLDLCRLVRTHPQHRRLPILMLTAAIDAESIRAVYDAGADDYASKPILGDELLARVHNRLVRVHSLRF